MSAPTLSLPVANKDITIVQGADFKMALLFIERDANGVAQVINTASWDLRFQIRPDPSSGSPLLIHGSVSNGYITRGIEGIAPDQTNVRIKIPASITAALSDWGKGGYDLIVNYANGERDTLLTGQACLKPAYGWW